MRSPPREEKKRVNKKGEKTKKRKEKHEGEMYEEGTEKGVT